MSNDSMIAFDVILFAGNGKSLAFQAMDFAENRNFQNAEEKIKEAEETVNQAHQIHKDLLTKIANGENLIMDLLMTHALDHMTSAEDSILLAKRIVTLYRRLEEK